MVELLAEVGDRLPRPRDELFRQVDDVRLECDACDAGYDQDGDGMPDERESDNDLSPANASDAAADNDTDGYTSLQEYLADTDPNEHDSALWLRATSRPQALRYYRLQVIPP